MPNSDLGQRVAALEQWQKQLDHELYGNGQVGLIARLERFLAQTAAEKQSREEMQKRHDKAQKTFIARAALGVAVLTLVTPWIHDLGHYLLTTWLAGGK